MAIPVGAIACPVGKLNFYENQNHNRLQSASITTSNNKYLPYALFSVENNRLHIPFDGVLK